MITRAEDDPGKKGAPAGRAILSIVTPSDRDSRVPFQAQREIVPAFAGVTRHVSNRASRAKA